MPDKQTPYMLLGAVTALLCSPVPIISAVTSNMGNNTRTGLFYISASLLLFGLGEVLNHPAHSGNRYKKDGDPGKFNRFAQRRRIPCGLGNLLFIVSLLLLFIGMAKVFTG